MSADDSGSSEHRLIAERRRKLEQLRSRGFRFPNGYRRSALAGQLLDTYGQHSGEALEATAVEVAVGGRMLAKRVMGRTSFAKLQDRTGQIQVLLQQGILPDEVYQEFKGLDLGDILWARGTLFRTRTGELTVRATELVLLTK